MTDTLLKCQVCHGLLDEEDLFCPNCGREAPRESDEGDRDQPVTLTHQFDCQGCGASMGYDASAQNLRCPFCGSERLEQKDDRPSLQPRVAVPFCTSHEQVMTVLRKELGSGFWRPSDLAERAVVTKMAAVYVPFWVFRADTHTYWTADTDRTPPGARGDWAPMFGEHRGDYDQLLVGASGSLTPHETDSICPFDLQAATPPDQLDFENKIVERFRVQRKFARPLARRAVESMEAQACSKYVPGRARNVKVNVQLDGLSSYPVLLPVWIMAYEYKGKNFRYVINGQTARASGRRPYSFKMLYIVLGVIVGGLIGFALMSAIGALNAGG